MLHEYCDENKAGCYYDEYEYKWKSHKQKKYYFMEFSSKYEDILIRQCENKKKDECKKLAHVMVNHYGVNNIDSPEYTKKIQS